MPLSLRYIKELAAAGIDWRGLHIIDLTSLIYSLRIDNARQMQEYERKRRMQERGISKIVEANTSDVLAL